MSDFRLHINAKISLQFKIYEGIMKGWNDSLIVFSIIELINTFFMTYFILFIEYFIMNKYSFLYGGVTEFFTARFCLLQKKTLVYTGSQDCT